MADRPSVYTKQISRAELAEFLPSPRAIRAFENMIADVSQTIPDSIEGTTQDQGTILAGRAFASPTYAPPVAADESQSIIASQIFGA